MGSNLDYLTEIETMTDWQRETPGALLRSLGSATENCWAGYWWMEMNWVSAMGFVMETNWVRQKAPH